MNANPYLIFFPMTLIFSAAASSSSKARRDNQAGINRTSQ